MTMPITIVLALIAFTVGLITALIAGLWTLILAFQDHWGWGLAYLFVPFASLIFIIVKWSKRAVRRSFFLGLIGSGLLFLAAGLAAPTVMELPAQIPDSEDLAALEAAQTNSDTASDTASDSVVQTDDFGPLSTLDSATGSTTNAATPASPVAQQYDYKKSMSLGYLAFKKKDYQTALINFQRALQARPGDKLAKDAIQNTQKVLQQSRS
jgi:hypothetical protein